MILSFTCNDLKKKDKIWLTSSLQLLTKLYT